MPACKPNCQCRKHFRTAEHNAKIGQANRKLTAAQRFWAQVDTSGECWLWTGHLTDGYGRFRGADGKLTGAHQWSYTNAGKRVPDGMMLDHICRVRHCVKPSHLRAVTRKQNMENQAGAHKNSSTGVRGVFPHGARYRAGVRHNGKMHWLGYFDTVEEAMEVAQSTRVELFTHNDVDKFPPQKRRATP